MDLVTIINNIVVNPDVKKGYEDLRKYYTSQRFPQEAQLISALIAQKFHANSNNYEK